MATLLTINKGDSFSIAFALPAGYNQTRINSIKVRVGSKIYTHTVSIQGLVECQLTSEQTALLSGSQQVVFTIDDDVFGVKVIVCGDIVIRATNETYTSESVNTGNNVVVTLTLTETAIEVDDVLYDYVKGSDGTDGTDGTNGTDGTDGKTAYESAVDGGYIGTEEQFNTDLAAVSGKAPIIHDHKDQSINPDNIVLNKSYTDTTQAALSVGTLFYNSDQLCWLLKTSTETYLNMGEELPMICKNGDSSTHTEGTAVYISSGAGQLPVVQRSSSANGKCNALATQDILHTGNARGYYCFFGQVRQFPYANVKKSTDNENTWVDGAALYLCSEDGKYSTTKEDAPAKSIKIGTITNRSGANISVLFSPDVCLSMDDLCDVDGTDTTIADTDTIIKNDASVWKKITWANVKTLLSSVFESLSNKKTSLTDDSDTFYPSQKAVKTAVDAKAPIANPTFTGIVKSPAYRDEKGNTPFALQNGGIIYHTAKWFTPASGQTLTVASNGLSVTLANPVTNFQFVAGMVAAKLIVSGYEAIIASYTSSSVVVLSTALDASLRGQTIAYTDWGVYSQRQAYYTTGDDKSYEEYSRTGAKIIDYYYNSVRVFQTQSSGNNWWSLSNYLKLGNAIPIQWSSTTAFYDTIDLGLRRNAAGLLEIYNGVTNGAFRDIAIRNNNLTGYLYNAASPTADTVNDTRSYNSAGVTIHEVCTVANAAKGGGTWANAYAISELGSYMVSLLNKTGANSVKGTVVSVSDTTDNAFRVNPIDGDMPIGVVYNSGIADGAATWVVVSGIAEVLLVDTVATTRSYVAYSSGTTAGRLDTAATAPAATVHFREVGHTLESKTGGTNVLVKCILHFN